MKNKIKKIILLLLTLVPLSAISFAAQAALRSDLSKNKDSSEGSGGPTSRS